MDCKVALTSKNSNVDRQGCEKKIKSGPNVNVVESKTARRNHLKITTFIMEAGKWDRDVNTGMKQKSLTVSFISTYCLVWIVGLPLVLGEGEGLLASECWNICACCKLSSTINPEQ